MSVSAVERLLGLPEVFRGSELSARFSWTSKTTSQYLYLWRQRGLVSPLGGHSDVFVNTLVCRENRWGQALQMAMPSAIVMGLEALRAAGWITQVPRLPTVAVNRKDPVYATDRFEVCARSPAWFDTVRPGVMAVQPLPVLHPAWALADLLHDSGWGECGLTPDDIDTWMLSALDHQEWKAAALAFGLPESLEESCAGATLPACR